MVRLQHQWTGWYASGAGVSPTHVPAFHVWLRPHGDKQNISKWSCVSYGSPHRFSVQVDLLHHDECKAQFQAKQKEAENLIPLKKLQRKWSDGIRKWTIAGLQPLMMKQINAKTLEPRKLGKRGRRNVTFWGCWCVVCLVWVIPNERKKMWFLTYVSWHYVKFSETKHTFLT